MGMTIRPATSNADLASQRLADLHDDKDGIHQGTARVLHAIYRGTISSRETRNDHRVQLGALKNRGAITIGSDGGPLFAVTDDVAYSLNPLAPPPPTDNP